MERRGGREEGGGVGRGEEGTAEQSRSEQSTEEQSEAKQSKAVLRESNSGRRARLSRRSSPRKTSQHTRVRRYAPPRAHDRRRPT